ncbi:MAG: Cbb3-type cytochrome c oxidase subunit CcoN1 [Syntrophomonadaceae bacterium]|nr:Cbb3-type cytochrome c oxidase subunit CcoN1 [Bacillota bacterium]
MAETAAYEWKPVKGFALSGLFWGAVTVLIGLFISIQLWIPELSIPPFFTYGRLRAVHVNGLVFGFVVAEIFALSYYMVQRLTRRPLLFPKLAMVHLYIFNIAIVAAAVSLLAGMTQSKEYAELEWPLDIGVVILWVMFAVNILGTIIKRKEEQMYISLWFLIATVIGVAVVYIVNNLAIPVGLFKSYSIFAGVNDANVQWWYGHNAVGFVFTTAILAIFYYFLPKSTGLPIFSHRLSIISFWSLVFAYLWTGAHHLVYTPLPDWIQTLAIVFSMFLIAPSWGSVVNGYYTVGADWDKMRTNYLTKFFIMGITFYALQTVQGATQGLRVVNQLIHYTDWVIGHVHMGTMGWVAMTVSAAMYYTIPKVYNTEIYSVKLANVHFWFVLIGQLIFSITMWILGIQQGAMWKAVSPEDGSLTYTFMESLIANYPYWKIRTFGGLLFFIGLCIFAYNIVMTAVKAKKAVAVEGR